MDDGDNRALLMLAYHRFGSCIKNDTKGRPRLLRFGTKVISLNFFAIGRRYDYRYRVGWFPDWEFAAMLSSDARDIDVLIKLTV